MPNLAHHTTDRRIIRQLPDLPHPGKTQGLHDPAMLVWSSYDRFNFLDFYGSGHELGISPVTAPLQPCYSASTAKPRLAEIIAGDFVDSRA